MANLFSRKAHRLLNCIRTCNVNSIALYSRRNNARKREGSLLTDGYLDSDYMARHDPRFFLPGSLGQSWQVNKNFRDICLTEVVDYFNHSTNRLHIKSELCPLLLRAEVQTIFPGGECYNMDLTKISLIYKHFDDEEKAQKYFYTAAKIICHRVMIEGFWADFINPYTGKPEYDNGKRQDRFTAKFNAGVLGPSNIRCLYIKPDKSHGRGLVYTDTPDNLVNRLIYDL